MVSPVMSKTYNRINKISSDIEKAEKEAKKYVIQISVLNDGLTHLVALTVDICQIYSKVLGSILHPTLSPQPSTDSMLHLWRSGSVHINEELGATIQKAADYLSTINFKMKGVPGNPNCLFYSILESYATLQLPNPSLDQAEDKVGYLRSLLAEKISADPKRRDEIKNDQTWIHIAGEGELLAQSLGMPIRVLTARQEGIIDRVTFPEPEKGTLDWTAIGEAEKPLKYIFLVDLGSHIVPAIASDEKVDSKPLTPEETVELIHQDIKNEIAIQKANYMLNHAELLKARDSYVKDGQIVPITKQDHPALLTDYEQTLDERVQSIVKNYFISNLDQAEQVYAKVQQDLKVKSDVMYQMFDARTDLTQRYLDYVKSSQVVELKKEKQTLLQGAIQPKNFWEGCEAGDLTYITKHIADGEKKVGPISFFPLLFAEAVMPVASYINRHDDRGLTPLSLAVQKNHLAVVRVLLKHEADPKVADKILDKNEQLTDQDGNTPLYWAANKGFDPIVIELLNHQVDINIRGENGRTPLHTAAYQGHDSTVKILLRRKECDPNLVTEIGGTTPLHDAIHNNQFYTVLRLLNDGRVNVNLPDANKETPLEYAARMGNVEAMYLIASHFNWRAPKNDDAGKNYWLKLLSIGLGEAAQQFIRQLMAMYS